MKKITLLLCLLIVSSLGAQVKNGYPGQKTRMLFLLDGSGSMLAEMGNSTRWAVAVTLMNKMVDTLRSVENLEVGLRVFGHTQPNEKKDCNDTKLEVPFAPFNHKQFAAKLKTIKPLGYTSIAQSLLASAKDFPADPTARNIIIIITDGVEECGGDPCAISIALQQKGIILRPFVIGLGTDSEAFRNAYSCTGRYFNAETPAQFQKIIGVIINQALNNTTVQINLLDNQGLPRETDVPLTIFDADNGQMVENVIHTMNGKGVPDTLYLDPVRRYRVVAHTKPQVSSEIVEMVPGKHNVIPLQTPQGSLLLKMRDFIETKTVVIRSIRLLEELRVFIWKNGKQQAMSGYNDDLVMAFAIAMYLRETSLRFKRTAESLTHATLNAYTKVGDDSPMYQSYTNYGQNPWQQEIATPMGKEQQDLTWLL